VFDSNISQKDIYNASARSIVTDVIQGYNGTIFAYGQTGSGKTFTMMGNLQDNNTKGVIPRVVDSLFEELLYEKSNHIYLISVSFIEIYCEKLSDLLNQKQGHLKLREGK